MTNAKTEEKLFCLEKLEKDILEINGADKISPERARRITVDGFGCFIQSVRQIDGRIEALAREMREALEKIEKRSKERTSARWWFVDKVLPSLLSWTIIGIIVVVITWVSDVSIHIGRINP